MKKKILTTLYILVMVACIISIAYSSFGFPYGYTFGYSDGQSMYPTIKGLSVNFCYNYPGLIDNIERGEIVSWLDPTDGDGLCKRVIGFPGEEITIDNNRIYIDGKLLHESYTTNPDDDTFYGSWVLQDDEYFIMGDNRANSFDSRFFGPVKQSDFKGKIVPLFYNH